MDPQPLSVDHDQASRFHQDVAAVSDGVRTSVSDVSNLGKAQVPSKWGEQTGPSRFRVEYVRELDRIESELRSLENGLADFAVDYRRAQQRLAETDDDAKAALEFARGRVDEQRTPSASTHVPAPVVSDVYATEDAPSSQSPVPPRGPRRALPD